jgi:hypothetical protein
MVGLAGIAAQPKRAARLLGAAQPALEAPRARWQSVLQIERERIEAAVRAQLDEAAFAAAWEEGRATALQDWDRAVAYALEEVGRPGA